ncbi:unnamed protein product [Cercopithifilaria johnstoni]|uniref:7TM GPCR serpentine receptor class x (Srx) domain-containing protein n=1 Tax=Cercopithifilaria johnstoni TaxID=2874296 RepID=A0A8J2LX24_9BILA|nr:unnamed protein product [Cercopithifilaria johnstoni]
MLFIYSDALCAQIISLYCEFYVNLAFVIFIVLLDVMTFYKLKMMAKPTQGTEKRRRSQEIRCFIQSVCSETVLILTFVCFWCISPYGRTTFAMFVLNAGAWLTMHATDGFIMIAFNHHIFAHIKKTAKKTSMPMVTLALSIATPNGRRQSRDLNPKQRWLNLYHESKLKMNKIDLSKRTT